MRLRTLFAKALALGLAVGLSSAAPSAFAEEPPIVIKLGTVAPVDSRWGLDLKEMGQRWRDASGGRVKLQIYGGGVSGDEGDLVRGMGIGKQQAATISVIGLSNIAAEPMALCVPQLLTSNEELDYVRDKLTPQYEELFRKKGYTVLHWADAGWLRFFSRKPFANPEGMRNMKVFVWTGETGTINLWKDAGFQPVPLAATDISLSLQSGLIDVVPMTALSVLATQANLVANNVIDFRWAPLVGATIVRTDAWEKIPADLRPKLMEIARETGLKLRASVRRLDDAALETMRSKGMSVQTVSPADRAAWVTLAENAHAKIRTSVVDPASFDAVKALRDEYRKAQAAAAAKAAAAKAAAAPPASSGGAGGAGAAPVGKP